MRAEHQPPPAAVAGHGREQVGTALLGGEHLDAADSKLPELRTDSGDDVALVPRGVDAGGGDQLACERDELVLTTVEEGQET